MSSQNAGRVGRSPEETHVWLRDMAFEFGTPDEAKAYRALRAVLHTLRDQLTVDQAARAAAQLPPLAHEIFYEGWDPSRTPSRCHDAAGFIDRVESEAGLAGEAEASSAVAATSRVLRKHIPGGELDYMSAGLPEPIGSLFADRARA